MEKTKTFYVSISISDGADDVATYIREAIEG